MAWASVREWRQRNGCCPVRPLAPHASRSSKVTLPAREPRKPHDGLCGQAARCGYLGRIRAARRAAQWCVRRLLVHLVPHFHAEKTFTAEGNRALKKRLVKEGRAHAALVFDGDEAVRGASTAPWRNCPTSTTARSTRPLSTVVSDGAGGNAAARSVRGERLRPGSFSPPDPEVAGSNPAPLLERPAQCGSPSRRSRIPFAGCEGRPTRR